MGVPGTSSQPLSSNTARSDSAAVFLGDLVVFGGLDHDFNDLSSVECLFTRHNLFERRLQEIGAAELIADDHLPIGAWPHILARAVKKKWYSHVFYLLREKNGEIFGQR